MAKSINANRRAIEKQRLQLCQLREALFELRLPRIRRFVEVRNVQRYSFEDYLSRLSSEEQQVLPLVVAVMKVLLLRTLAPKRVAGLGGLVECQSCGSVGATMMSIRHRN